MTEEISALTEATLERWRAARLGLFIHWGPVTLSGEEIGWSRGDSVPTGEYDALASRFNPTGFDAEAWVEIAKRAGAKYLIPVTKHHDGFCLWDTAFSDYKITRTPYARDIVQQLAEACLKADLPLGVYYSVCDFYHPDFPLTSPGGRVRRDQSNLDAYTDYLRNQVRELVEHYGPLLTLWFDMPMCFHANRGQEIVDYVRKLQPGILINNRTAARADYDTPEQRLGGYNIDRPWETCATVTSQWSYKPNDALKSAPELILTALTAFAADGNFLLNVAPNPLGIIEDRQVAVLEEFGAWMAGHSDAVYGTRGGPYPPCKHYLTTRKDHRIFLHVIDWPTSPLHLPPLAARIDTVRILNGPEIPFTHTDFHLDLDSARAHRDPFITTIELTLDQPTWNLNFVYPIFDGIILPTP